MVFINTGLPNGDDVGVGGVSGPYIFSYDSLLAWDQTTNPTGPEPSWQNVWL